MATIRLTMGQAVVNYLANQHVERDGVENRFFAGLWGIFGHGNIGGIAQAVQQHGPTFPYYLSRNEQAMVHAAVGYAKQSNRLRAFACLSSIGPGATNMVTGAASATINHVPVLLLAGDMFAERVQAPVLQQLEHEASQDVSVNDAFRPVVRYWDRIGRPEQVITALPEVMRILTSPAETGAVLLALPQDIQTYAYDYPVEMFQERTWSIPRNRPDTRHVAAAARMIRDSRRPIIFAGGGVRYSDATDALRAFAEQTGIPVAETHAGKGSLPYDHRLSLGGAGVSGTLAANVIAPEADLVIGIGTRFTDFPTASKTAFQDPNVRFININVAGMDAFKHAALPLLGDARATLQELSVAVGDYVTPAAYQARVRELNQEWDGEVERVYAHSVGEVLTQGEVIGAVEASAGPRDVVVTSAGSLPGDLLKPWRSREPASYQVEYGYSTMGYEIAGGLGAKMAAPDREVYVLVGDGSFLMMSSEITTAIQEGIKLVIVVVDNKGFSSVGRVSEQVGAEGFGCHYRLRGPSGDYDGEEMKVDFVKICEGFGARALEVRTLAELRGALQDARSGTQTVCIVVQTDWHERVRGYAASWWEMATPQVSEVPAVVTAREDFDRNKVRQRYLMIPCAPFQAPTKPRP
ncbi:3D-(3,5/4)-trihydroxycyclohexane-1,2-dione acylhydrolase (decyclizing) [soil metagenome]